MLRELEQLHGEVKYIVLASLGIEHKGTTGAFAAFFPQAQVYIQPGQYSFPLNLPTQLFFPVGREVLEIPRSGAEAPWYGDIDHEVLGTLRPRSVSAYNTINMYTHSRLFFFVYYRLEGSQRQHSIIARAGLY